MEIAKLADVWESSYEDMDTTIQKLNAELEKEPDDISLQMIVKLVKGFRATSGEMLLETLLSCPIFSWCTDYSMDELAENLPKAIGMYNEIIFNCSQNCEG